MDVENIQEKKKVHGYIFGDILGGAMSKVPLQVQFEAGMMSMSLMMIGLTITTFYLAFYLNVVLWYKIFLIINCIAGLVFFWSNLLTQFQQYQNYMEVQEFNKTINQ
jgi:hypothetical protein